MKTESTPKIHLLFDGIIATSQYLEDMPESEGVPSADLNERHQISIEEKAIINSLLDFADEATTVPVSSIRYFDVLFTSFLQAIDAVFLAKGVRYPNEDLLKREFGRSIVKGEYGVKYGFYCAGHYGDLRVHRLVETERNYRIPMGAMLESARIMRAWKVRKQVQSNPNAAIRSTRTGAILQKFSPDHWQQITWRLGYTTILDVLYTAFRALHIDADGHGYARMDELKTAFKTVVLYYNDQNRMRAEGFIKRNCSVLVSNCHF